MKRGDVVIATGPGFGTKPRPFVVMQADDYLALTTVILMPTTSVLADPPSRLRVPVEPDAANGLEERSEVMTDIPVTVRVNKVHRQIGVLSADDMSRIEQAMMLVLGFVG